VTQRPPEARGLSRAGVAVQHQRVPVRIAEEGHVANARVEGVGGKGDTALLERGPRGRDGQTVQCSCGEVCRTAERVLAYEAARR
jgi:hypothetical protein